MFAHHEHLESAAAPIFEHLAREKNLAGLDPERFSTRAAHYPGDLNALHPFREGNGRAQREFIGHVARASGYSIAWENVGQPRMLEGMIDSFRGHSSKPGPFIEAGAADQGNLDPFENR
jgi:cell filamentation protein, protein adenylyltransferase